MTSNNARIVSSAHLVSDGLAELSEFEYGLIVANNAFGVWCVGWKSVATIEILVAAGLANLAQQFRYSLSLTSILPAAQLICRCGQML